MNLHYFYALYKKWFDKKEEIKVEKELTLEESKAQLSEYQRGFRKSNDFKDQEIANLLSQIIEIGETMHDSNGKLKSEYNNEEKRREEFERIENKYK